ncbi:MAG: Ig-like domain-containing protein [Terriglobales bacterium]
MMKRLQLVVWLLLVSLHPYSLAQLITIHVIDVRNGRPVQNRQVSLSLLYSKGEKIPGNQEPTLRGKTDSNGKAEFTLPEPGPAQVSAWADVTSLEYWWCSCYAALTTQELTQKGYVTSQPGPWAKNKPSSIKAVPAEILFLARPFNLFERILAPLERE